MFMQSIQLGPFTFATSLFAFMVAALLGLFLAAWLDRRKQAGGPLQVTPRSFR
jgi:hypothetical protein